MVAFSVETPPLAAVLPAETDGLDAHAEHVRLELEAAGAETSDESEGRAQLGPWRSLTGRPAVSIAFVPNRPVPVGAPRFKRSLDILRTFLEVPRARRRLSRLGYAHLKTFRWHVDRLIDLHDEQLPERGFYTRAYVTGSLSGDYETVLDRALALAGRAIGAELRPEKLVSADSLVAICEWSVLRVSLRPATRICLAYTGLEAIQKRSPKALKQLVPRPLAQGEIGAYRWSLEERKDGLAARAPLSPALTEQAFDFVSLLAEAGEKTRVPTGLAKEAGLLGMLTDEKLGPRLEEAAGFLEEALAPLPRVAGHGDFWAGNLLVEDDRLRGVVDWESWNPSELPLLDFLHLHLLRTHSLPWGRWGPALLAVLLPFARGGGDERVHAYCKKLGVEADPLLLERLVWAYWIRRAARLSEYYEWRNDERCLNSAIRKVAAVFLDSAAAVSGS